MVAMHIHGKTLLKSSPEQADRNPQNIFNARNRCLAAKRLKKGYRYHKLRETFSKFYRRHYGLISKFNVGLKSLLHQGLSEQTQNDYG